MSNYIVSARKYRPKRFDEVVGQEHVTQTLKNSLKNDLLAHAFLFCGPRGVGKTTCARILAKVLNCEHVTDDHEPCNACDSCAAFDSQSSFNIIELDAASNNSVEHIRNLTDQVRFPPQQGEYKVFIIDEVHMLSQAAFNAFLKTLEEPPPYAIFILATTEKHKIIPTILSRCQVYDFKRIEHQQVVNHLKSIAEKEGVEVEEEGLHVIAQKSEGALRDSLSIFDRMVSFGNKHVTYSDVAETLNVLDIDYYFKTVEALMSEDVAALLNLLDNILANGFEPDDFVLGLANHIRDLLVCKHADTHRLLEGSNAVKEKLINQSQSVSEPFMYSILHLANDFDVHYKAAKNKRLHTEIHLIKMAHVQNLTMQSMTGGSSEKKTSTNSVEKVKEDEDKPAPPPQDQGAAKTEKEAPSPAAEQEKSDQDNVAAKEVEAPKMDNLSLDALDMQLKKDQSKEKKVQLKGDIALDHIRKVWIDHVQKMESPIVKSSLKNADIELREGEIEVRLGKTIAKKRLLEEQSLMEDIRNELNDQSLILKVVVDPTKAPPESEKVVKPLTTKEKYNVLLQKNPYVKELKDRFDLKVDHDV